MTAQSWSSLVVAVLLTACAGTPATSLPPGTSDRVQLTLEVHVPATTPAETLYLAGNLNGWDPAALGWSLGPLTNGVATGQFTVPKGYALQFKVTRGSWEKVEKDDQGQEIANRLWTAEASGTLVVTVGTWRDAGAPAARSTVTGTVVIVAGPKTPAGDARTLRIRLPEGYDGTDRRYPVLYMHDGQNLFDAATSFAGEWKIDETLSQLEAQGRVEPTIVVGIDNSSNRLNEYSPYFDASSPFPGGKAYADWLVATLKPWIDQKYRTKPDAAHTALAGSSMGGLISLYTALEHPGVFGQLASFSGAFWFGQRGLVRDLAKRTLDPAARVYLDVGGLEAGSAADNRSFAQDTLDVAAALKSSRDEASLRQVTDPRGVHNEADWAKRFGPAFLWLRDGGTP